MNGAQGSPGLNGAQGAPGLNGAQGSKGDQGAQGSQGDQGAQGSKGDQGAQGSQGDQGAQGSQGLPGLDGAQGPQGPQGPQGASTLCQLTDVSIPGCAPNNGDVIQYDTATSKWINEPGLWEDLMIPATSLVPDPVNPPVFQLFRDNGINSRGVYTYFLPVGVESSMYFSCQLPNSYKEGSDIYPHIHYSTVTPGTGLLNWGLEYTWANTNNLFPITTVLTDISPFFVTSVAYEQYIKNMTAISGTFPYSKKISSMIVGRVYRSPDTYDQNVALLGIGFHFEQSGTGSSQQYVK